MIHHPWHKLAGYRVGNKLNSLFWLACQLADGKHLLQRINRFSRARRHSKFGAFYENVRMVREPSIDLCSQKLVAGLTHASGRQRAPNGVGKDVLGGRLSFFETKKAAHLLIVAERP